MKKKTQKRAGSLGTQLETFCWDTELEIETSHLSPTELRNLADQFENFSRQIQIQAELKALQPGEG